MPAYHLIRENGQGVTLVNIGVGPSNAKNITDHLAVLRPHCWLMVGHCGGLRQTQIIGDYVLAHAYLRQDGILDELVPPDVPVPALAEVQVALQEAAAEVTGEKGDQLKNRLRTGTVVTQDDRNWELRWTKERRRINLSRAIAVDMESGTIAAQGYRLRVPYGTLLCVSDKPLHGEIKLPGAANAFYERAVSEHLRIGLAAGEAQEGRLDDPFAQAAQLRRAALPLKAARPRVLRGDAVDLGELVRRQRPVGRLHIGGDLLGPGRTGNDAGDDRLGREPGEGELDQRPAARLAEVGQRLDLRPVRLAEDLAGALGQLGQPRPVGHRGVALVLACQRAVGEREIGQQPHAVMLQRGDQVLLGAALEQAVLVLSRGEAGRRRSRAVHCASATCQAGMLEQPT